MPKLRSSKPSRSGGKFKRECGCCFHNGDFSRLVRVNDSKRLLKPQKEELIERGFIKKWTTYICDSCIDKGTRGARQVPYYEEAPVESESSSDDVYSQSQSDDDTSQDGEFPRELPRENKEKCRDVGKLLGTLLGKDTKQLYNNRKLISVNDLLQYNPRQWLSQRPDELLIFLCELCNINIKSIDDKQAYLLAKAVEQLYNLRNPHLVLPLSMRENVVMYSFTSSKLAANLLNHVSPAGSYRTLIRCLDTSAEDPITIQAGTSRCAFDNNQIIGKTYTIKGDNKVPTSVMCSTAYISLDKGDLQKNADLKPSNWMWSSPTDKEGGNLLVFSSEYDEFFRDTRDNLLRKQIKEVYDDHEQQVEDHIDQYVDEMKDAENEKICVDCGGANDITYRVCRACRGSLVKPPEPKLHIKGKKSEDPFQAFEDIGCSENSATVSPGEPEFLNPNSFDTIVTVLRGIGMKGGIKQYGGNEREWMFVECDGLPYTIMRSLIDNVWACRRCTECFYGRDKLEEHSCYLIGKADVYREFSWVVPVVGLLHLEMNLSRSFIRLNWDIFMSIIAHHLGFKSEKAQKYCKKGSDHHKTFTLLEIIYLAFSKELVTPYVKLCIKDNTRPTVEGYWEWQEDTSCPNYLFIQQMTLTYLHALMLFRTGVRRNDINSILASKVKLTPMMYGQNHPKYQEILFRDMLDQVLMPPELKELMESFCTISRTGKAGAYQGGDAILEEINKDAKSWMKLTGVPNDARWQRVFRNLEKLKKVRDATLQDIKMSENGANQTTETKVSSKEVEYTRAVIRKSNYLMTPKVAKPHTSLDGKTQLNPTLVHFSTTASVNTQNYAKCAIAGNPPKVSGIPVTLRDLEQTSAVENMKIEEIKRKILDILEGLPLDVAKRYQPSYMKATKSTSKKQHLNLYYSLIEELELQVSDGEDDDDDD